MTTLLNEQFLGSLSPEIEQHPGWIGNVAAMEIEKVLKVFSIPYLYALRSGEKQNNYYVSYFDPNAQHNKIVHRPFMITLKPEGWYYENTGGGGPYTDCTIDQVLHLIMHCEEGDCIPYIQD